MHTHEDDNDDAEGPGPDPFEFDGPSGDFDDADSDSGDVDGSSDDDGSSDSEWGGPSHVFFENEPLIRALNDPRRRDNDPEAAQLLFRGLIGATLIALIPDDVELDVPETGHLEGDVHLALLTVQHAEVDGDIIPMFTDEGALGDFADAGGRYVALAVRDLFPLLASTGEPPSVVVNPGGGEALLLTPTMVLDIVEKVNGYRPIAIDGETEVTVGLPAAPLEGEMLAAVQEVLAHAPGVVRCFQFEWQVGGVHEEPVLVLALEFEADIDDDVRRASFEVIQDGIEPALSDVDEPIDLIDLKRQQELFASLVESTDPLYER